MLKPTHVSFECLRDKIANLFFAGLAPDVSGICPAMTKLLFLGWFVGSSDNGWELRRLTLKTDLEVHYPGHTGRVRYGRPEANG